MKYLSKILSFLLALLVLFSTLSFTFEKHFCGDTLVDVSLFKQADKCATESIEIAQKKTCCKDEVEVVKGQDELKFSDFEGLDIQPRLLVTIFTYVYLNPLQDIDKYVVPHINYSPPNLVTDIQVLDQVFII